MFPLVHMNMASQGYRSRCSIDAGFVSLLNNTRNIPNDDFFSADIALTEFHLGRCSSLTARDHWCAQ